jgi:hypothetical protein
VSPLDPHQKALAGFMRDNARRYRLHEVFRDFCEVAAITLSNAIDRIHYEAREARYMQIIKRYEPEEVARFPAMLAELVNSLERGHRDALGELFMSLNLGDDFKGQFFTPYAIASLMARLTVGDVAEQVSREGFITVNEPACGAGGMVIAFAEAVLEKGVNYQTSMHVIAQDIDLTAVHMAYVQLSLLHVPAIVVHGNTITLTEWDHWATPAHVLGMWDLRLKRRSRGEKAATAEMGTLVTLGAPTETAAPADQVEPAAPAAAPSAAEVRSLIVEKRLEKADQLSLFG